MVPAGQYNPVPEADHKLCNSKSKSSVCPSNNHIEYPFTRSSSNASDMVLTLEYTRKPLTPFEM